VDALLELVAIHMRLAEFDYAPQHPRQAIAFGEALLPKTAPSRLPSVMTNLALAYRLLAWALLRSGENQEALTAARKAKDLDDRAASRSPAKPGFPMVGSLDLQVIGVCYLKLNDLGRARDFLHRANGLRRSAFEMNRQDEWIQNRFLDGLTWEGWVAERQGDWAAAGSLYRQTADLLPALTAAQSERLWSYLLGFVYGRKAVVEKRQGRRAAACELFGRAATYYKAGGPPAPEDDRGARIAEVRKELADCARR
jgi:tetratricopeptide (TPR) repeat protein